MVHTFQSLYGVTHLEGDGDAGVDVEVHDMLMGGGLGFKTRSEMKRGLTPGDGRPGRGVGPMIMEVLGCQVGGSCPWQLVVTVVSRIHNGRRVPGRSCVRVCDLSSAWMLMLFVFHFDHICNTYECPIRLQYQ